jgi:hypothetical protein
MGRHKQNGRQTGLLVRTPQELLDALDAWIAAKPEPRPSRPEAIRLLVRGALGMGAER